ncbi:DUF6259 domain-containing protein [Mariniphaga sediminis]|uniref:DUF6259 domain-containing protein n=1 Tax=Mariniphaga sediminis TaxID=1628158 RepID=UPI003568A18C
MKTLYSNFFFVLVFYCISLCATCSERITRELVFIENGKLQLGFDKGNGSLIVYNDLVNPHSFIEKRAVTGLPWEINFYNHEEEEKKDKIIPTSFNYMKPEPFTLILNWSDFSGNENKNLKITAIVTLDSKKALSYWSITAKGIKGKQIQSIIFPKIEGIAEIGNEKLAFPHWMGQLINDPRSVLSKRGTKSIDWNYPGPLSMQCIALYDKNRIGFYASCNDSLAYTKNFSYTLDTLNTLTYKLTNYPSLDSTLDSYTIPYEATVGSFKGDWINAAEQYREWGVKQKWSRESRFPNKVVPNWLENTALWVWNRGMSDNVLTPAVELKQKLELPVNVIWHWWHGCSYDEGFPEYFPPREGGKSFIDAVSSAQQNGVNSMVYMNQLQWGDDTESWEKEQPSNFAVKDINGNMLSHTYNIFTGKSLTNMCMGTSFWRNKYASLCDRAVNTYQTNGVYMDQACTHRRCYDSNHSHSIGGGNYWVTSFGKLTNQIRSKVSDKNNPAFAGEGCGEVFLPFLDAMLTLQVSRERYAGVGEWETIPFFQAVYHEYALTYGSYSSLVTPPYDELWPKEYSPKETEQLLDADFNKQFLMEQARAFVWGMQPTIANYHSFLNSERAEEIDYLLDIAKLRYQALKYLLYGEFCRSPQTDYPEEEIKISKLSIYAGRKGKSVTTFNKKVSLLYSGTWKAKDNSVGIALASISNDTLPVHFSINSEDYKLSDKGKIYITTTNGKELLGSYSNGLINVEISLQPRGLCIVEIVPSV